MDDGTGLSEKGSEDGRPEPRPIRLFAPIYGGLGAGLSVFFIGSGFSTLALFLEFVESSVLTMLAFRHSAPRVEAGRGAHALRPARYLAVPILCFLSKSS